MSNKKKDLGQFFTTKSNYIIGDLVLKIKNKEIIDPFVGNWDLLNEFDNTFVKTGLDIDPKTPETILNDSLMNPFDYMGKAVITNPPFLLNNKSKNKDIIKVFEKYKNLKYIDLFQISLHTILTAEEGIIIVPHNFWTGERSQSIRKRFLNRFYVNEVKMFEKKVFDDTDYAVCAFYFTKRLKTNNFKVKFKFVERDKEIILELDNSNNFSIKPFLNTDPNLKLDRVSIGDTEGLTNIKINMTDSRPNDYGIKASSDKIYYSNKNKDRHFMTLKIPNDMILDEANFILNFNSELTKLRDNFMSLFLGNYRNNGRKKFTVNESLTFSNYIITKYSLLTRKIIPQKEENQ
jgi:hypothetical protein